MTDERTYRKSSLLPVAPFGDRDVTRLIIGGNPFRGNSHQSPEKDRDMEAFYTVERIKAVLRDCERHGVNTVQARGDALVLACIREHWAEGGQMQFIAQTASELRDLEGHVRHLARFGAAGVYVHGTYTDRHFQERRMDVVRRLLEAIRNTGARAGVGTHMPEVVDYIEEQGWAPDFYMTALYNISRARRESALVSGVFAEGEAFDHNDRRLMFERIRATPRQCLVFKVLGAGRLCDTPEQVKDALAEAYANIKPGDALVVGMFPKYRDEIAENARLVKSILDIPPGNARSCP
ncbi:MAG TPA: hypothetical protein ENN29_13085 [Candidatus Hydrogenedentes bacterium]|nr:hypothetical protein [Candidatus Hydrogenedentota bacterium]